MADRRGPMMTGMAFGAGSAIAHNAVRGLTGGGGEGQYGGGMQGAPMEGAPME